jgi:hypothetical protein
MKIEKPDTNNVDPKYWEEVLESHGLGIRQLGLQEAAETTQEETDEHGPEANA